MDFFRECRLKFSWIKCRIINGLPMASRTFGRFTNGFFRECEVKFSLIQYNIINGLPIDFRTFGGFANGFFRICGLNFSWVHFSIMNGLPIGSCNDLRNGLPADSRKDFSANAVGIQLDPMQHHKRTSDGHDGLRKRWATSEERLTPKPSIFQRSH
jgi:hypothetical protein